MAVLRAFTLAIGQLGDRRLLAILAWSLVITLLIFVAIGAGLGVALRGVDPCAWFNDDAGCPIGGVESGLGAILLAMLALWLLFPAVAIGVLSTYMDRVVSIVEAEHYPRAAARARRLGLAASAWIGIRSSLRLLIYNLVALPLYILLLVTGVGTILLFVVVNGVALGRDLGEMVAARHLDRAALRSWLAGSRGDRALMGMAAAVLFMLPVVNLVAPLVAAAMAAHLFHDRDDN
jgi:CysZ protein